MAATQLQREALARVLTVNAQVTQAKIGRGVDDLAVLEQELRNQQVILAAERGFSSLTFSPDAIECEALRAYLLDRTEQGATR